MISLAPSLFSGLMVGLALRSGETFEVRHEDEWL